MSALSKRLYYALAVLILLLSAMLRLWNLVELPQGFSDVEISHINVVEDSVQRGSIRVFYEREIFEDDTRTITGQEGLYHIILGAFAVPAGIGTFGLRVLSVLLNMLTLAVLYALGVRLFGYRTALVAISYYSVMMFPVILSRLVLVETAVPLVVASVMLALARAFPVYSRMRAESSNTIDFAAMGILISLSLYVHHSSLFMVLMAMAFITYMLVLKRQVSSRRLSYIGFGVLMVFIVAMPYLLSTFRLPELSARARVIGDFGSITLSIIESTLGVMWLGDSNPLYNVAQRPLVDAVSGFILLMGVIFCIQKWRNPRYALVLIAIIFLGPAAILGDNSPNFLDMAVILPVIALLIGIGTNQMILLIPRNVRPIAIGVIVVLWAGNLIWTVNSLFNEWANSDETQAAYNSDLGNIALHFDKTADEIPVVICHPDWNRLRAVEEPYSDIDLIKLHMNHDSALLREVDCRNAFVFANAGQHQQVLIIDPFQEDELFPLVADWLSFGTSIEGLPEGTVTELRVQPELEDALGVFTTTAPATYATEADVSTRVPVAPPIRFGGNITWLGYESDPQPEYMPGMLVPVSTYWRIEGLVPSDLTVFTHLLSDPLFPAAQVDTVYIDPRQLRERDIYLHNANVQLQPTIEIGSYVVSVGVYQQSSDERLPVFINESATQGNRIFLYEIGIIDDGAGN